MKTKEFIKQVEELGYKTVKVHSFITVYDPDNMDEKVAAVSMRSERQLSISDAIYTLAKLLVDYAETPLDEREDETRYYVKLFGGDRGYLNIYSFNHDEAMISDREQNKSFKTQFTATEIEQLKQRNDMAIDWDKVKLIEVDDDENV